MDNIILTAKDMKSLTYRIGVMELKVDYHIVVVHLALHVREIITDTTSGQSFCIVVVILVSIQNYYSKFAYDVDIVI